MKKQSCFSKIRRQEDCRNPEVHGRQKKEWEQKSREKRDRAEIGGDSWEELLKEAFEPPRSHNKQCFLRSLRRRRISNREFILVQASYIKKRVWVLSFAVFGAALAAGRISDRDILWLLAAMMPLLAVSAVTECFRAEMYGMTELEMATRFSLKSVVLARMSILGVVHFGTLIVVCLLNCQEGRSIFRIGIYLLFPYLLTDITALGLFRRMRGREASYVCLGLAVMIGMLPVLTRYAGIYIWQGKHFGKWILASAILCVVVAYEWIKSIRKMEEMTWS